MCMCPAQVSYLSDNLRSSPALVYWAPRYRCGGYSIVGYTSVTHNSVEPYTVPLELVSRQVCDQHRSVVLFMVVGRSQHASVWCSTMGVVGGFITVSHFFNHAAGHLPEIQNQMSRCQYAQERSLVHFQPLYSSQFLIFRIFHFGPYSHLYVRYTFRPSLFFSAFFHTQSLHSSYNFLVCLLHSFPNNCYLTVLQIRYTMSLQGYTKRKFSLLNPLSLCHFHPLFLLSFYILILYSIILVVFFGNYCNWFWFFVCVWFCCFSFLVVMATN